MPRWVTTRDELEMAEISFRRARRLGLKPAKWGVCPQCGRGNSLLPADQGICNNCWHANGNRAQPSLKYIFRNERTE